MSVNRPQAQNLIGANGSRDDLVVPPFWELEELIENGLERAGALAVMAARRMRPVLAQERLCEEVRLPVTSALAPGWIH